MALEFEVSLTDGVSVPALSAADRIKVLKETLTSLQKQMVKSQALGDAKGFTKAKESFHKITGEIGSLKKGISSAKPALQGLSSSLSEIDGIASQFGISQFGSLSKALANPYVAAVALAAAITAAGVAAVAAGMSFAVSTGEARLAWEASANAMAGNVEAGGKVLAMAKKLSAELPITSAQIKAMSKQFMAAGITGAPQLERAIRATTAATLVMDEEAGARFSGLITKLEALGEAGKNFDKFKPLMKSFGLSIEEIATAVGTTGKLLESKLKTGAISAAQLGTALETAMIRKGAASVDVANRSLGVMVTRVKAGFMSLFNGIIDTPGYKEFINAMQSLMLVFSANTAAGKTMKGGVTSAFGSIFSIAASVITALIILSLKFATGMMRIAITCFPVIKAFVFVEKKIVSLSKWIIKAIATNKSFVTGLKVLTVVLFLLCLPLILLAVVNLIVIAIIALLVLGLILLFGWIADHIVPILKVLAIVLMIATLPFWIFIAVVALIIIGFIWLYKTIRDIFPMIKKKFEKWISEAILAGSNFVDGLITGCKDKAAELYKAIAKIARGAVNKFKSVLGIASPSKIMVKMGGFVGEGLEEGLEASAPGVEAASGKLGIASTVGIKGGGGSRSGTTITVEKGAIQIIGGDKESILELTEEALTQLLERLAIQQGLLST